jgi:CRISPR-associated protein Cas2
MGSFDKWYLLTYDIRDPKRYRQAVKIIKGYAERVQYSVFRCKLSNRNLEKIRLDLAKILAEEDNFLVIPLCPRCAEGVKAHNEESEWLPEPPPFQIID